MITEQSHKLLDLMWYLFLFSSGNINGLLIFNSLLVFVVCWPLGKHRRMSLIGEFNFSLGRRDVCAWSPSPLNGFSCQLLLPCFYWTFILVLSQCLILYGGLRYQRRLSSLLGRFTWLWGRFGLTLEKDDLISWVFLFILCWKVEEDLDHLLWSRLLVYSLKGYDWEFLLYLPFGRRVVFYDLLGCVHCYEICGVRWRIVFRGVEMEP